MMDLPRGVRRLVVAGKCALAAGLLVYLVRSGRLDLAALATGRGPGLHVAGVLLVSAGVLLQSVRWWRLLAMQGLALPFLTVLRVNWIGYFYALILPGTGGGDLVRGLYVLREAPGAKLKTTSTLLADRAVGLYASLCLGAAAFAGAWASDGNPTRGVETVGLMVVALLAVTTAIAGALLWGRSRNLARRVFPSKIGARLAETMDAYARHPQGLALAFLLSLASNGLFFAAFWVAGRTVGVRLSIAHVLLVVPLVFVANALPLAPGGFGVGETTAAVLFATCGVTGGAALMLTVRVWQALARLPGLLLQVSGPGVNRSGRAEGASDPGPASRELPGAPSSEGTR
jgi:hypothetical protein